MGEVRHQPRMPVRARLALGYVLIAMAAALAGFVFWPRGGAWAARPVDTRLAGRPLEVEAPGKQARELARRYLAEPLELKTQEHVLRLPREAWGVRVDTGLLEQRLRQASDPRSPMRRLHARGRASEPLDLPMPARLNAEIAMQHVLRLKDAVDREPVDARIDVRNERVIPARAGARLDTYATLEALDEALRDGSTSVQAAVQRLMASRSSAAVEDVDLDAILARFETHHNRTDRQRDRTHNLRVAASKLDGLVVEPGAELDFNRVVGKRTKANGFRPAPVIAQGEVVEGMGGGTCQIASTLHGAVYFAGLEVLERHPHTRPSFYIKLGLDAAVADGTLNFRFRNDLPFPIVIGMHVEDGVVHAEIRGERTLRRVTFLRRIERVEPFEERTHNDPELPSGMRILAQRGIPGFEVTKWQAVRDRATGQAVRRRSYDVYPPTTQVWRVGTNTELPEDFELPPNDSHPEYVADEFMAMTPRQDAEGYALRRRAGRTGTYGWIEREGMLKTDEEDTP